MIRIICKQDDNSCLGHTGAGASVTSYKTFDIECPELEAYLHTDPRGYVYRSVIGVDLLAVNEEKPTK